MHSHAPNPPTHLVKHLVDKENMCHKAQVKAHGAILAQQQKHAIIRMLSPARDA